MTQPDFADFDDDELPPVPRPRGETIFLRVILCLVVAMFATAVTIKAFHHGHAKADAPAPYTAPVEED